MKKSLSILPFLLCSSVAGANGFFEDGNDTHKIYDTGMKSGDDSIINIDGSNSRIGDTGMRQGNGVIIRKDGTNHTIEDTGQVFGNSKILKIDGERVKVRDTNLYSPSGQKMYEVKEGGFFGKGAWGNNKDNTSKSKAWGGGGKWGSNQDTSPSYTAPTYTPEPTYSSYNKTTRNAAGALGAIMLLNEISKQTATPEQRAGRLILSTQKQFKEVSKKYEKRIEKMNLPMKLGNGFTMESSWIIDGKTSGLFASMNYKSNISTPVTESDKPKIKQLVNKLYCGDDSNSKRLREQGIGMQIFIYNTLGQSVNAAANLIDCLKAEHDIGFNSTKGKPRDSKPRDVGSASVMGLSELNEYDGRNGFSSMSSYLNENSVD